MYVEILHGSLSDIYSDILSGIILTFFLTFYLAYIYFDILSDILSGIKFDILGMPFGKHFDTRSSILSGMGSRMNSDILSGILTNIFWHSLWHSIWHRFWHLFGTTSGISSNILRGVSPPRIIAGRSLGEVQRAPQGKSSTHHCRAKSWGWSGREKAETFCAKSRESPSKWATGLDILQRLKLELLEQALQRPWVALWLAVLTVVKWGNSPNLPSAQQKHLPDAHCQKNWKQHACK